MVSFCVIVSLSLSLRPEPLMHWLHIWAGDPTSLHCMLEPPFPSLPWESVTQMLKI